MNYEEFLVPVEIAKELKEIGFDKTCLFHHIQGGVVVLPKNPDEYTHMYGLEDLCVYRNSFEVSENTFSIPTYEQVFDWFWEKKYPVHFLNTIECSTDNIGWIFCIREKKQMTTIYSSYKDARQGCIRELIKIYKNENSVPDIEEKMV